MKKCYILITMVIVFGFISQGFSQESGKGGVTGNFYYDIATGHKYIKNPGADTYREFSQRGKLLRDKVSNQLPLLVTNKYIRELKQDHYLLYEKIGYQKKELMVLSPEKNHPSGWACKKMLVSMH